MSSLSDEDDPGSAGSGARKAPPPRRNITVVDDHLESRDLFIGTREIIINHSGVAYRLRLTGQNRLILTK